MEGNSVTNNCSNSSSSSPSTPTSSTTTAITPQAANLQLHDLLCPTEKAESLLETLTPEQITLIEQTLQKIREKKLQTPVLSPPTTPPSDLPSPPAQEDWSWAATQVAKALADAMTDASKPAESTAATPKATSNEPITEVRDGVEWVSFVYSHHRILKRYCIRTDLDKVDINQLDDKFKRDNCVYPRANLPRETYRGNRWAYETECNMLGWKLAWLNASEIAGKRGLIQRAVDSYRNRYPSMRSRRVARQEKLLNGTLRKRKHREGIFDDTCTELEALSKVSKTTSQESKYVPKTISIDDGPHGTKCRIRINIESVPLEAIDMPFRQSNCVFPRAMNITPSTPSVTQRQLDEAACNELGWKLAWLNPRQLANRKSLLQRVLDIYRTKFAPHLKPRKYSMRTPPAPFAPPPQTTTDNSKPTKLTAEALAAQQQQFSNVICVKVSGAKDNDNDDDQESTYSGTTASLDFRDCFSPPAESAEPPMFLDNSSSTNIQQPTSALLAPTTTTTDYSLDNFMLKGDLMLCDQMLQDDMSCQLSVETNSSNPSNQSSPRQAPVIDNTDFDTTFLIGDSVMDMNLFGENEDVLKRYLCAPADHCELPEKPVNINMDSFVDTDPGSLCVKMEQPQDIDPFAGSLPLF